MAILNIGSINWDEVHWVAQLPEPGETIICKSSERGTGGKGLNQSVAVLRSGGELRHVGAIGVDDVAMLDELSELGVSGDHIAQVTGHSTGQAMIVVDDHAENHIVLKAGANRHIPEPNVAQAIAAMKAGDWLLMQNETNLLEFSMRSARAAGLNVAFAAAPFSANAVIPLLPLVDLLAVNEVEYSQLLNALGDEKSLPSALTVLVTKGSDGAELYRNGRKVRTAAVKVDSVDTTGAGDTFFGYFLSAIDQGANDSSALSRASAAAALQVTRTGAVSAIPSLGEVTALTSMNLSMSVSAQP